MQFWITINHEVSEHPVSVDYVFSWNIRYQILCSTQDELDEIQGWQLIYGRKVEADTFDNWKKRAKESRRHRYDLGTSEPVLRMLPIVITTFRPRSGQFRGL